jgi:hypothetical protein
MLELIADGRLAFNSRLPGFKLLELQTTEGQNKSGTMTFTMPPQHPARDYFTSYRTVVELYEDGVRRFRGRALYPDDDYYNNRTITCEGERGFLRDGIARPYLYQDTPAAIFAQALELYNASVDPWKRFTLGTVTVTDANDYIRFESTKAEDFLAFFDKLVERCGGYITFTDDGNGGRAINWLAEINTQSNQTIEFGSNLLEFARSGQSPDLYTAILPYGAQLENVTTSDPAPDDEPESGDETETQAEDTPEGETPTETEVQPGRVTISSVTEDGADFIQDDEAVALRGVIMATVTWDDVTEPENLLAKARKWLAEHRQAITSLQLTAADLSRLGHNIDGYHVGDRVRVLSKPHQVDDYFQLTDRTVDWLNPAGGKISLGKTRASLAGADVAGDRESMNALDKVKHEITADYKTNVALAIQAATLTLSSLIQQTSESIMLQVAETYATDDAVVALVQSQITQLADSIEFTFTKLQTQVEEIDGETRTTFAEWEKYIRFENGDIVLGEAGNEITLRLENDRIRFLDGGAEVAYISNKQLYITDAHFLHSLRVGRFAFLPRENGNLSLVKVGG